MRGRVPTAFTLFHDDPDGVCALQIALVRHSKAEHVLSTIQTGHRSNRTVCILDLDSLGAPGETEPFTIPLSQASASRPSGERALQPRHRGHALALAPVVGDNLLVVAALAAVQRGTVHGQRQLLLGASVGRGGLVVFCRGREAHMLGHRDQP